LIKKSKDQIITIAYSKEYTMIISVHGGADSYHDFRRFHSRYGDCQIGYDCELNKSKSVVDYLANLDV